MKANKWLALMLAASLALAVVGCKSNSDDKASGSTDSGSISVAGSDTMVNLAQGWQEKFNEVNPDVMISVKGGGSGTGIAALLNGTVDFANASRNLKDEEKATATEKSLTPVETEVAKDGIAVIANPGNNVSGLTLAQLGQIYRGEVTNWKDVGGADADIVLLSRDSASGTYEYFKEEVVANEDENAEFAKGAKLLGSSQAIVDETKGNPNAIGYVGLGYLTPDVKVVEIDGTAASVETALDGSYVLSRGLFMITNGAPAGVMKTYLDWILSDDGQAVVVEQGFVPLSK